MQIARLRSYAASIAVVAGGLLIVVTLTSTVKAIRIVNEILESPGPDFHYVVVPAAWNGLLLYGFGVVGGMMFRATAARIGRSARIVWKTHLSFTTLLLLGLLGVGAVANGDLHLGLVGNAVYVLMLLAHGIALVCGGTFFLRATRL